MIVINGYNQNIKSKFLLVVLFLLLLAAPFILQACQNSTNELEVLSLEVTPQIVKTGEKAKIITEVKNNSGEKLINSNIPLMVNGVADNRKFVSLEPGASEKIEFTLLRNEAGIYTVRVGQKESTLEVKEPLPPDFKLSELEINPIQVNIKEKVVITANLLNTGETEGKYNADLIINDTVNQKKEIIVPPGLSYMFVFTIFPDSPGTYNVKLGNLTGQFTVLEPAIPVQITPTCPPSSSWDPTKRC